MRMRTSPSAMPSTRPVVSCKTRSASWWVRCRCTKRRRTVSSPRSFPNGTMASLRPPTGVRSISIATASPPVRLTGGDAVAMEIDLTPVGGRNEAMVPFGNERGDDTVRRRFVHLHRTHQLADLVLQLTTGRVEGIADGDVRILMSPGHRGVARDIDVLAAGYGDVDADAIRVAAVVAMLWAGDHDARGCNAVIEALEPLRLLAHGGLNCVGMADVFEDDVKPYLHRLRPREGMAAYSDSPQKLL